MVSVVTECVHGECGECVCMVSVVTECVHGECGECVCVW